MVVRIAKKGMHQRQHTSRYFIDITLLLKGYEPDKKSVGYFETNPNPKQGGDFDSKQIYAPNTNTDII